MPAVQNLNPDICEIRELSTPFKASASVFAVPQASRQSSPNIAPCSARNIDMRSGQFGSRRYLFLVFNVHGIG
jgi:hypothetical protein